MKNAACLLVAKAREARWEDPPQIERALTVVNGFALCKDHVQRALLAELVPNSWLGKMEA